MVPRLWWLLAVFWSRCLGLTSTSMIRPRQYRLVLRSTACYSSTTPNHEDDPDLAPITDQNHSMTLRQRLRGYIRPRNNDDELSFRQRLGKMGLACMLSYGWISNLSVGVCVSASWYVFSKKVGQSVEPGWCIFYSRTHDVDGSQSSRPRPMEGVLGCLCWLLPPQQHSATRALGLVRGRGSPV